MLPENTVIKLKRGTPKNIPASSRKSPMATSGIPTNHQSNPKVTTRMTSSDTTQSAGKTNRISGSCGIFLATNLSATNMIPKTPPKIPAATANMPKTLAISLGSKAVAAPNTSDSASRSGGNPIRRKRVPTNAPHKKIVKTALETTMRIPKRRGGNIKNARNHRGPLQYESPKKTIERRNGRNVRMRLYHHYSMGFRFLEER